MPKIGYKMTEEHKRKIGEKTRIRNIALGIIPPSNIGKKFSAEHREKISKAHKGKKFKRKSTILSVEMRKKMSEARKGEKCRFWRGGITPINKAIRRSLEYRMWRESVFQRDNFTCVFCGARSGNGKAVELHSDHIKPFAYFPELRFSIENGRTLCVYCHRNTDTFARRAQITYDHRKIWQ